MGDEGSVFQTPPEGGGEGSSTSAQSEYSCAHLPMQSSTEDRAIGSCSHPIVNEAVTRSLFRTLLDRAERLAGAFNSGEATNQTFVQEIYQTLGDVCKLMEATDHHLQETLADLAGIEMAKAVAVLCEFMKNLYCRKCLGGM